jgi:hypothetical protein
MVDVDEGEDLEEKKLVGSGGHVSLYHKIGR